MRFNFNITSLFSSMNSKNDSPFGSINLSDYSLIKRGGYKKLMKSYYDEQSGKTTNKTKELNSGKTDPNKKGFAIDKTGLTQMKKEADGLKTAVEAFNKDDLWKQTNGEYDMEKIAGAVKNFVSEYNDVVSRSSKVDSKEISQSMGYMSSMTGTMSKALSKIGVTVGFDGKLAVNEDALKKASVTSVRSLFEGSASYGSQVEAKASEIARATIMNSSLYLNNATLSSTLNGMYDKLI
ncbi:MAG: hypothetical protein K6G69_00650 [Lachnospiraceae bacterium]|nr:hypothetical protein [Lachnospiraceae bacterium]